LKKPGLENRAFLRLKGCLAFSVVDPNGFVLTHSLFASFPSRQETSFGIPLRLCVPKTSYALICRKIHLTLMHNDCAAVLYAGRFNRAIQVEEST
jgi:hypothetical protein